MGPAGVASHEAFSDFFQRVAPAVVVQVIDELLGALFDVPLDVDKGGAGHVQLALHGGPHEVLETVREFF